MALIFFSAVTGDPSKRQLKAAPESTQQHERRVIETCRKDYEKKKEDPRLDRNALAFVYTVCEKLESDYRAKWGTSP